MGYRVFKDSQGTEWQTWDVVPHLAERRAADRRQTPRSAVPSWVESERRIPNDRRVVTGRRPVLSAGLDGGWLCFEAPVEKRRLTPIPSDWLRCDESCLERYCKQAKPARNSMSISLASLDRTRH